MSATLWKIFPGWMNRLSQYRSFFRFRKLADDRYELNWRHRKFLFNDATSNMPFDRHYIYHTAWAARILEHTRPEKHIDISSLFYFSALVSAFVNIEHYDFREVQFHMDGLHCGQADLTRLHFEDNSIQSLSCMHTVEHIGLGRYGDPIDPKGDIKAIKELQRVLAPGGHLIFVSPVGRSRIYFNAHRVMNPRMICEQFDTLQLEEFSMLPDYPAPNMLYNLSLNAADEQNYACGCFHFTKPINSASITSK